MKVIDEVDELLLTNQLKHRHHPGISSPRQVQHPSWLCNSIKALAGGNKKKKIGCVIIQEFFMINVYKLFVQSE